MEESEECISSGALSSPLSVLRGRFLLEDEDEDEEELEELAERDKLEEDEA